MSTINDTLAADDVFSGCDAVSYENGTLSFKGLQDTFRDGLGAAFSVFTALLVEVGATDKAGAKMLELYGEHLIAVAKAFDAEKAALEAAPEAPPAPWYPDDSGLWVEHTPGDPCPVEDGVEVEALSYIERDDKEYRDPESDTADAFAWDAIVAYKIVA